MALPSHTRRVHEVVKTLREKPEHERQRMALGVSFGFTLIVALGWLGALSANHTLAINPTSENAQATAEATSAAKSSFSDLLGAAGAAFGGSTTTDAAAEITVVDSKTTTSLDQNTVPSDQTVIHF